MPDLLNNIVEYDQFGPFVILSYAITLGGLLTILIRVTIQNTLMQRKLKKSYSAPTHVIS